MQHGTAIRPDRKSFGEITVKDAEDLCLRAPGAGTISRFPRLQYTWRPQEALREQLPAAFELSLQAVVGTDGLRCFYPWNSFEGFLAQATTGGLAILWQRQKLSGNQRHSYRAMRLLFLRARRRAEFLRHRFDSSRDLTVAPSGQTNSGERDILPEDLGLDTRGQGQRWSVRELIERGKAAACSVGYVQPTIAQSIHYGLIAAARLNPLTIAEHKVPDLVHSALFNVDANEEMDPEQVETVTERLLIALQPHLLDENSEFEKWFLGPKNSLVHQLSKKKQSPGGELDEGDVRKALLHLGWQAYQFASNCVHAQMRIFQNALPSPLTDRERVRFEHAFLRQPYLGNLSLMLLAPRFGFVKGLLWDIWERLPDLSGVPVLHKLLDFYATMAVRRREADRAIKRGRPVRLVEAAFVPTGVTQRFQEIAAEVRELHDIDCGCPRRDWWAELKGKAETEVRIGHHCTACDFQKETVLTPAEFTEIGRTIL